MRFWKCEFLEICDFEHVNFWIKSGFLPLCEMPFLNESWNETFLTIFKHCEQSSNNTEHKKRDPHYVNTFVYIFQVLQPSSSDIAALRPKIGIELDSGLRFPDWQYNYRNSSQKKERNSQCQWQVCVLLYQNLSLPTM